MFSFFKKDETLEVEKKIEEDKSFFSKALEKTFSSIKSVVPQKKRENIF